MHTALTQQQSRAEAERCLQCFDAPCAAACPVNIDVPKFISMVRSGNLRGAAEVVKSANVLANVCGAVCPEEIYCQLACVRGLQDQPIKIRELHYYATQDEWRRGYSIPARFPVASKKVAVVGAGPAGLGCAFELAKFGYQVDLFDSDSPGGVPRKSIPVFRLSHEDLESDVEFLKQFCAFHQRVIDDNEFERLRKEYNAIFLGTGLGRDKDLGIEGERLQGVYPVLEFLEKAKAAPEQVMLTGTVVVVGGGNVSLDAAATARRLGASTVILMYRRSEREMKVWRSELEECKRQGIDFRFLTIPAAIVGDTKVTGVLCRRTKLSAHRDQSGRPVPLEVKGSDFVMEAEVVIIAVGQLVRSGWINRLEQKRDGFVKVNERFETSLPSVFAGGDLIFGEGTIVQSVAHGKLAARAIQCQLMKS